MAGPLLRPMNEPDIAQEQHGIFLTPEGYLSLQAELEQLTMHKRPEIADRIRESLQHGEFSEDNSELDEVKFEQAMVENRIAELKAIFGGAQVLDMRQLPTDIVGIGNLVKVKDVEFKDSFEVRIVMSIEANPAEDLISNESPMGTALIGHKKGDTIEFDAPEGKKRYQVVEIKK